MFVHLLIGQGSGIDKLCLYRLKDNKKNYLKIIYRVPLMKCCRFQQQKDTGPARCDSGWEWNRRPDHSMYSGQGWQEGAGAGTT